MKQQSILKTAIVLILLSTFIGCKRDAAIVANTSSVTHLDAAKKSPLSVVYVEVNSNNLLNTGCYTLQNSGKQLFDISIIFAANINYDAVNKKAMLYNNTQISYLLQNKNIYIKPLQDKGLKVLLSVLGNHQGAGISNFTSRSGARKFARQLRDTVAYYNLDGIDFDDEYADYGNNGTTQPNDSSFVLLLGELRSLMPDKIISFYYYGPATNSLVYKGYKAGQFLNYSWNPYYGSYLIPQVPGLKKSQLAPAAIWINNTAVQTAESLARQTKTDGYGAYLYYDLTKDRVQNYLSGISAVLYNDSTHLESGCLQNWVF